MFFVFRLLNWIDQYTICENQSNGWKVTQGGFFSRKFPGCSPRMNFENFFSFQVFRLVELNRSVYCLWKSVHSLDSYFGGIFFTRKINGCSPSVKFGFFCYFHFFQLVNLNWSVCWLEKSVKRLKSYLRGIFNENVPFAPLEWNFDYFILLPLLRWIDQYTVCESRLNE
jgi:hypothetical protein